MKSTSTLPGMPRNLKVINFILISCLLLTLNNFKSYGQTRNYATIAPSTGLTTAVIGLGERPPRPDAAGGSVLGPGNAAIGDNTSFATLTCNYTAAALTGTVGEAWLQLKFPQPVGAGKTTYIRFDPLTTAGLNLSILNLVTNLTGLLKNETVKLEAYSGATAGGTGTIIPAANVMTTIVQDPQGNNYFAITSSDEYNSVRIRLSVEIKLLDIADGSTSMKVYNAFTIPGGASCGSGSFASVGESAGINVSLTPLATNPTAAADNNINTFSQLQVGLVGVGATISQTIFFGEPSASDAVAKVWLSIPSSILTVNVFNEIKLQAFNGNTAVGPAVAANSLLGGLDLLGLLSRKAVFPVFYTPGGAFDRIQVSLTNGVSLGGNLVGGGLNIHEAQITVAKPTFAGKTAGALAGICGNTVNLSVSTPVNGLSYNWYRKSGTSKTKISTSTTGAFTETGLNPGAYMYYVSANTTGCSTESDLDSATVTVTAIPVLPVVTANPICSGSAGILTVTNAESGVVYNWYTASNGGAPVFTGSTITTGALTENTTYYVEGVRGACLSASRTPVTITVNGIPADAQVSVDNVTITSGQTATLTATATTGSTINWYAASSGGVPLTTGSSFTTPALTSPTTYFVGVLGVAGCPSANRIPVTVSIAGVIPSLNCKSPNAQTNGVDGLLCLLCGVTNPTNAIDADPATFSTIRVNVGVAAGAYQRLIFPAAGVATDSIRLILGTPGGLADLAVLGGITVNVMNGNTIVSTYQLSSGLINLQLLQDKTARATIPAGAIYDRVELRGNGVVQALTTLNVYSAEVIYPNPVIASTGQNICSGAVTTLTATPAAGTTLNWFANATGGASLASGNTYSPTGLTTTTIYYVEVSKAGCANTDRVPVTVTVNPAIVFATTTLNNATAASLYSKQITAATGGTPVFSYSLAPDGNLPAGLSLSTTGLISGTPTANATTDYNFSIIAKDSKGCIATTAFNLTLTSALTLPSATLPNGVVTVVYPNQPLPVATGGTGPYTYVATNTPPGLTFNTSTPGISGTPTQAGTYPLKVTVTDINGNTITQTYTIVVKELLVLPPASLANGTVGINYPAQKIPEATGGTGPYTYTATGLAPGHDFNISTREITGIPTTAGSYAVLVTVTDAEGKTASNTYPVNVGPALVLPPATLADGNVGVAYTPQTIPAATGGTSPYTYTASNLPLDLTFDPITRVISGTPAQSGLYSVLVTVTDNMGTKATNTYSLRVIGALSLPSAALADGTVGTAYPAVVLPSVTGGTGPYTYTSANVPAGLTFDPATNTLSGTPTIGGTFTFQITAKDAANNTTTTDYVIKVKVADPVLASTGACSGTTATLSATNSLPGITYNWYAATGNTPIFTGNSFTTPALTANTTYYVEAVSGTAVSNRISVIVTVRPTPALAVVTGNQIISAGQTATLVATADAGNTISWFSTPTGGSALSTGASFTTPTLTADATYYIETQNTSGCVSATRVPVLVTVTPLPTNANCNAATGQQTAIDGICLLCGITNAGGSTDGDPATFSSIHLTVGLGATGYQRLIFANPGNAADSIRLDLGFPVGLADVGVLSAATVTVFNGTTIVSTYPLNSTLINLSLLNPNRLLATVPAGGVYDRIEIRFGALVSALSTLDIYGATVIYPNPTVAAAGQTTCAGSSTTLTATANGDTNLKWYATANSGTVLASGPTFTTPILNATTTYYIEVSRGTCANLQRIPVTVTITPAPTEPVLATELPVCYGSTASLTVNNVVPGLNYNWYTAATGGASVFSGATFVTPALTASTTYYVEANSPGCGSSTRTAVPVTVNPIVNLPQVTASATTVNAGQTVILNISPVIADVTYNWYTDLNGTSPVYSGPTYITPPLLVNTTYYVEAKSNLTGCLSSSRVQVTINVNNGGNPNPVPCEAAISETNGVIGVALLSGVFNPQLAFDNDTQTGSSLLMPVGALGAYVYQRLNFGSISTVGDTVKVLLNTPGKLLSLGLLSNIQVGTYNGATSNNDAVEISNNLVSLQLLSNDTQALLTFVPTVPFDQVEVRLNSGLAGVLSSVNLNYAQRVMVAPILTVQNPTACANQALTLSVLNPNPSLSYKWYDATGATVLSTGPSFSPTVTANTIFYVSANTATCTSYKTKVSVTVTSIPDAPTLLAANVETCSGSDVVLTVKDPINGVTYRWYDSNNVLQAGKDGPTFTIQNVTVNATYSVEAFISSCNLISATKTTATIVVGNLSNPVVLPESVTVSSGAPAVLTATSSTAGAIFKWYTTIDAVDPFFTGAILQVPGVVNSGAANLVTNYYVTAELPGGCASVSRSMATVTVLPAGPAVDAPCEFASVQVNSGVDGVAVLTGVFNPENAVDNSATTASSLVMPVGALGASVYQTVGFTSLSNIGDTVRVRVTTPGKLLNLALLSSVELTTYNNLVSNNDMLTVSNPLITLQVLSNDSEGIISFVPARQFDAVELRLKSGLAAVLSTIDLNYVQRVQIAPKVASATVSACVSTGAVLSVLNPNPDYIYKWYIGTATTAAATGPNYSTASNLTVGAYDYYVSVTRNNCESAKTKVTVTVLAAPDAPVAVIGNPTTVCPNAPATTLAVTAVAGVTYNWYDALTGGNLLAANTSTYTTTANLSVGEHNFFVEAVNANSCVSTTARTKITLTVNPSATAADITVAGADLPLCNNNTATLTANSTTVDNPVFNWYSDETLSTLVFTGPIFKPVLTASTIFYVTVSGDNKCANNAANAKIISIVVNPPAIASDINVSGAGTLFCAGSKASLLASSPNVVKPVFTWYSNAALTDLLFTGPLYEPVVTASTTFFVSVSGDNKCPNLPGTGKAVAITVNTPATAADITVTGNGSPFCAGTKAGLSASSNTVDNPQFVWYSNAALTVEVFRGAFYEPIVTASTTFYVTVSGTNKCSNNVGNAQTVAIVVNAPGTPADISIAGVNTNYCKGSTASLKASSATVDTPIFTWYNDVNLTDVAFSGPVFEPVLSATTTYYVTVRGVNRCENGIAGAKIVTIVVNPTGLASDINVAGNNTPFCVGTKALLTATADQVSSPVFTWYSDAALTVVASNGPVFEPVVTSTTTYYVTVSGSNRCQNALGDAKIVTLIVNPPATALDLIVSGAEAPVCEGTSVKLTAANTTITSPVFTWYTDAALTNAVFTGPILEKVFTNTTTYYVTVKGANKCENLPGTAKEVIVTVNALPEVPVIVNGGSLGICAGENTTLSVQSPRTGTTYQWYDAATGGTLLGSGSSLPTGALILTKDYYLLATNTSGCGSSAGRVKVTVTVNVKPDVPSVVSAAVTACSGTKAVLSIANPVAGITYNWYNTATAGTALGTGVDFTTGPINATSTFYAEAVTATCVSTSRTMVVVSVSALPTAPASVSGATDPLCSSNTAILTVNSPDPTLTYRWYSVETGGTHIIEGTSFTTPGLTATTTYYVGSVNPATGCVSSSRTTVTLTILPKLAAPMVALQSATATSITFMWAAVTGARGYEVSVDGGTTWLTPSSGTTGMTHIIQGLKPDQDAAIKVRAIGQLACQMSDATTFSSKADNPAGNQIFIPNTFTPNNDGKNDLLFVYGNTIARMKLRIYNQWGQFLFESNNIQNGWDGTYKGEIQPNGVYVYQFEAELKDGSKTTKKGTITLLR
ncbi:Ig-like domain-containing protein [Pedobacter gandavensis]|uniref:T9SS type B sorting domain-containing protein n=1 Tax=Pedobacter gandavensis TaxID=2679963 RepID=A0ABR6EX68_9SPHI|nr:putative Ig domain-containing protein [Pedobacter gandavensis]MBB2149771.1 T9SS type B sorting domain-containing protein [Pedobacter gandavensis]